MSGETKYQFKYLKQDEKETNIEIPEIFKDKGDLDTNKIQNNLALKKDNKNIKKLNELIRTYNQLRADTVENIEIITEKLNKETPKTGIDIIDNEKENITELQSHIANYKTSLNQMDNEIKQLEQQKKDKKKSINTKEQNSQIKSKQKLMRQTSKIIKDIRITLRGLKNGAIFLNGVASFKTIDHTIVHLSDLLNNIKIKLETELNNLNKLGKNLPLFFPKLNKPIKKIENFLKQASIYIARLKALATKEILAGKIEDAEKFNSELKTITDLTFDKLKNIIESIRKAKDVKKICLLLDDNVKKIGGIREDLRSQIEILCKSNKYNITDEETINSIFCAALVHIYLQISADKDFLSIMISASKSNINRALTISAFSCVTAAMGIFIAVGSLAALNIPGFIAGLTLAYGSEAVAIGAEIEGGIAINKHIKSGSLGVGDISFDSSKKDKKQKSSDNKQGKDEATNSLEEPLIKEGLDNKQSTNEVTDSSTETLIEKGSDDNQNKPGTEKPSIQ